MVIDVSSKTTKAYKEASSDNPDKIVITTKDYEQARNCVEESSKTLADEKVKMDSFEKEVSIFAEQGERKFKGRFDMVDFKNHIILDYKTTRDPVDDESINKNFHNFRYDMQVYFYKKLYEAATGHKPQFWFLFQQTTSPNAAVLKTEVDEESLLIAKEDIQSTLKLIAEARDKKHFPKVINTSTKIGHPGWFISRRNPKNNQAL